GPCLRFPEQGQYNPTLFLAGLVEAISHAGGKVITGLRASTIEGGTPARVKTRAGDTIAAEAVVVATNTPVNDRVVLHTKLAPYLTYAVAFRVPPGAIPKALYWDTMDPYHYVRL